MLSELIKKIDSHLLAGIVGTSYGLVEKIGNGGLLGLNGEGIAGSYDDGSALTYYHLVEGLKYETTAGYGENNRTQIVWSLRIVATADFDRLGGDKYQLLAHWGQVFPTKIVCGTQQARARPLNALFDSPPRHEKRPQYPLPFVFRYLIYPIPPACAPICY